jgi:Phage integrase family
MGGCFRRIARVIGKFDGIWMSDLTTAHAVRLQKNFITTIRDYNETLESETLKIGRELSRREANRICREKSLFGPTGVRAVVSAFNLAARLSEEIDGRVVPIRLRNPKEAYLTSSKAIGSADPNKVLSPQQIAKLERVLGRELLRYDKKRSRIEKELSGANLSDRLYTTRSRVLDVQRYFGLAGFEQHTAGEIARLDGLSRNSDGNIPYGIRRFLAHEIGFERATELIKLRGQFPVLKSKKQFAELEASRKYVLQMIPPHLQDPEQPRGLLIQKYFGVNGFRMHSLGNLARERHEKALERVNYHIREGLVCLLGKKKARRLLVLRKQLRHYLSRAIKAQAVRLQLGVARRISAVVELPVNPGIQINTREGRRIVEINFRSGKTWGDEGLSEWIPCVDSFGEIAEDAIRVAQRLTSDLRGVANETVKELLFILPKHSFEGAVALSTRTLTNYIYKGQEGGLLRRYKLEELSSFSFHNVRQTHSTHMIEAGGTIQDVARYLGHTSFGGSTNSAGTFYLAGGTEAMRQRTAKALRKGAATGFVFDGVARLKIEALGDAAKSAPVRANQLSFEQARDRILNADIVDDIPMVPSEAAKLIKQKVVFNITRYGGCLLQATSGPCPTANPCPIGIQSMNSEPLPGCGCKNLVLVPDSVQQLTADIAIMDAQLSRLASESQEGWKSHIVAKREHYRSLLQIATSLNASQEEVI